jgi:hypothetical protein
MRYHQLTENYFPEEDEFHKASRKDSRKTRLTLRRVRDIRKADQEENSDFVSKMYAPPPAM